MLCTPIPNTLPHHHHTHTPPPPPPPTHPAPYLQLRTLTLDTSHFGFAQPQLGPCGGDRQYCCMEEPSPQTYPSPASCTGEGLACMQHGPDILCEAPRCAAPATVEGRPGVYSCPGGGVMLVGTLVGAGG